MASTPTIKKFIYLFDIICIILAAILIGFGAYILCTNDANDVGQMGAYGYIAVGVATFVVFIFLNCGAIRENVCCTVTVRSEASQAILSNGLFIVLIILVILAQTAVLVISTVGRDSVASNLANTLDTAWEEDLKSPGAMSIYETWFSCCGRASPQDYIVNDRYPPKTCFVDQNSQLPENLIDTGCRIKFEDYWMHLLNIFNILGFVLIALEFVLSFISCWMCISIRNDRRRSFY